MKKVEEATKSLIMRLANNGISTREISQMAKVSKSTASKYRKISCPEAPSPQNGRPRLLSQLQERNLVRMASCGRCVNAVQAQSCLKSDYNIDICVESVRRAFKRNGLHSRFQKKKPLLRMMHRKRRLAFARQYRDWTVEDWKRVIWSDESKFNVYQSDGRKYCWRRQGEPLRSHHIQPTVKYGGGSIMVWGCIISQGAGYLCRIDGGLDAELYRDILAGEFVQTLEWYSLSKEQVIFQHDNDPKHTARITKEWLEENKVTVLKWPAQSPDLNPIENLWNEVDRRIRNRHKPSNRDELWTTIEEEWENIEPEFCMKLIETMPQRIKDVLKAKGGYTRW
jgi:transposase